MITYPVNVESTRWSLHDGKGIVRGNFKWPSVDKEGNGVEIPEFPETATMLLHVDGEKPVYDAATEKLVKAAPVVDLDANTITTAWEVVALDSTEQAMEARKSERATLRAQWEAMPAHIRGPYQHNFEAANILLDAGDDDAAAELIDAVEPTAKIAGDASLLAQFNAVKAAFYDSITNLTGA